MNGVKRKPALRLRKAARTVPRTPARTASSSRASHLRRYYGIDETQYNDLLERQGGRCGVCLRHANEFKTRLAVDHNHRTGEVRGLLCNHCNRYVIGRHVDPELFDSAAKYLRAGTGWFVPENRPKRRRRKKR